jgi:hypothetical protein
VLACKFLQQLADLIKSAHAVARYALGSPRPIACNPACLLTHTSVCDSVLPSGQSITHTIANNRFQRRRHAVTAVLHSVRSITIVPFCLRLRRSSVLITRSSSFEKESSYAQRETHHLHMPHLSQTCIATRVHHRCHGRACASRLLRRVDETRSEQET